MAARGARGCRGPRRVAGPASAGVRTDPADRPRSGARARTVSDADGNGRVGPRARRLDPRSPSVARDAAAGHSGLVVARHGRRADMIMRCRTLLARVLSNHRRWVSDEAVPCAIAAYVRGGRPIAFGRSAYERLATAPRSILDRLRLLHDGAAAWRGTGRTSSSAVIVMGTWPGIGTWSGRRRRTIAPLECWL